MKNKVGISSLIKDSNGARLLNQEASREFENDKGNRRSTRNPTLDGGAVMVDNGYSVADRTFIVTTPDDSGAVATWAKYMVDNYNQVLLACRHGLFKGALKRWWVDEDGKCNLEILILTDELLT